MTSSTPLNWRQCSKTCGSVVGGEVTIELKASETVKGVAVRMLVIVMENGMGTEITLAAEVVDVAAIEIETYEVVVGGLAPMAMRGAKGRDDLSNREEFVRATSRTRGRSATWGFACVS